MLAEWISRWYSICILQSNLQSEVCSDNCGMLSFTQLWCALLGNHFGCHDEASMLATLVGVCFGRIQTNDNHDMLIVVTIQTHHCDRPAHEWEPYQLPYRIRPLLKSSVTRGLVNF